MWDVLLLLPAVFYFIYFKGGSFKVRVKGFSAGGPALNPIDPPALFLTYLLLFVHPLELQHFMHINKHTQTHTHYKLPEVFFLGLY